MTSQVMGEGDRKQQPGVGHQAAVVEGDSDAVRVLLVWWVLLVWGRFCASKTIIPEHGSTFLPPQHAPALISRWIGIWTPPQEFERRAVGCSRAPVHEGGVGLGSSTNGWAVSGRWPAFISHTENSRR